MACVHSTLRRLAAPAAPMHAGPACRTARPNTWAGPLAPRRRLWTPSPPGWSPAVSRRRPWQPRGALGGHAWRLWQPAAARAVCAAPRRSRPAQAAHAPGWPGSGFPPSTALACCKRPGGLPRPSWPRAPSDGLGPTSSRTAPPRPPQATSPRAEAQPVRPRAQGSPGCPWAAPHPRHGRG